MASSRQALRDLLFGSPESFAFADAFEMHAPLNPNPQIRDNELVQYIHSQYQSSLRALQSSGTPFSLILKHDEAKRAVLHMRSHFQGKVLDDDIHDAANLWVNVWGPPTAWQPNFRADLLLPRCSRRLKKSPPAL
jgi:hypothetical protein